MPDAQHIKKFTGLYRHGVDSKNRITIPAGWRAIAEGDLYARLDSAGNYVSILTEEELEKIIAELRALTDVSPVQRDQWIRKVSSGAQLCSADKQGRMVLPPEFCAKAALQGEVVLVGVMGQFQIWNSERWAAQQTAEEEGNQVLSNRFGL